jgi:hypothetical protein
MGRNGGNREYVSKGVSALPEWWDRVEKASKEMGANRSFLIRTAVDQYLKGVSAETRLALTTSTP